MNINRPTLEATLRSAWARWGRWVPVTWQVGGTLLSVGAYVAGTLTVTDVAIHIGILSFVTALYLGFIVPGVGTRRDKTAMFLYLLYAGGLALVVAPSIFGLTNIELWFRAIGMLALGMVLPTVWFLYIEYVADEITDDPNSS
jgi:hypothetical protein